MQNRSYLFVPATRTDLIPKAFASGADAVVVDWEDAVSDERKDEARSLLAAYDHDDGRKIWLRINGSRHPAHHADLQAISELSCLCGLILPKAEDAATIGTVARQTGLPLIAAVESARGWLALPQIAAAPGLTALTYGCLDLAADLNLSFGTPAAADLINRLRGDLVLYSAANGLEAPVASVFPDFGHEEGLRADIGYWRDIGMGGMLCIHPKQVSIVHELLHPGEEQLAFARKVCEAAERTSLAVFQIDGKMVDAPVITQCRRLLARYPD